MTPLQCSGPQLLRRGRNVRTSSQWTFCQVAQKAQASVPTNYASRQQSHDHTTEALRPVALRSLLLPFSLHLTSTPPITCPQWIFLIVVRSLSLFILPIAHVVAASLLRRFLIVPRLYCFSSAVTSCSISIYPMKRRRKSSRNID